MSLKYSQGFVHLLILVIPIILISIGVIGYSVLETNKAKTSLVVQQLTPTPSSTPYLRPINEGEIVFVNGSEIYLFDTKNMRADPLSLPGLSKYYIENAAIDNLAMSPDGQYLYFSYGEEYFHTYNFDDKKLKSHKIGFNANVDSTSPNGSYLVVDTGCCPGNRGVTILARNGDLIEKLWGLFPKWSPDSKRLVLPKGDISIDMIDSHNWSLFIEELNGSEVREEELLKADYQTSYFIEKWLDNENIVYQMTSYSRSFEPLTKLTEGTGEQLKEWYDLLSDRKISYWKMNIHTKEKSQFSYSTPAPSSATSIFKGSYSPSKQWKVSTGEYSEGQFISYEGVYILRSDNSEKIRIGDGQNALWRPVIN